MFRDALLAARPKVISVETPIGPCFIRSFTAGDKDEFERQVGKDGKTRCRLLMLGLCDESGRPLFTNADLPALDALPLETVEPIVDAIISHNKIGPKDLEDARKNSPSPAADSSTG